MVRVDVDDQAVIVDGNRRSDGYILIKIFYIGFVHAHTSIRYVATDRFGVIGPMDPIVTVKADPAVANRIVWTRTDLDARIIRINPGRIDFLILDGIIPRRRRRRRLTDADMIHLDFRIAFI